MNSGFKAHYFKELAELEAGHFWFRVRNKLIIWALHKYAAKLKSYLEIGCGTGFVLAGISKEFSGLRLLGVEYFEEGLVYARVRVPDAEFVQMDARAIPYESDWDVIGAFDVLEHIEEDELVLKQMYKALRPGGIAFLSVPQHPWLFSKVDETACHVRRYSARELHQKIGRAGFEIIRSTSFVSTLLPIMCLSRIWQNNKKDLKFDAKAELSINPVLNKIFEWFLRVELVLIRCGVSLPAGGSRFVVAYKSIAIKKANM